MIGSQVIVSGNAQNKRKFNKIPFSSIIRKEKYAILVTEVANAGYREHVRGAFKIYRCVYKKKKNWKWLRLKIYENWWKLCTKQRNWMN